MSVPTVPKITTYWKIEHNVAKCVLVTFRVSERLRPWIIAELLSP